MRQNFFYFHPKFEIDANENKIPIARDVENLLQLSLKVLFQRRAKRTSQQAETEFCTSFVQTILCSGRSVTYRCQNLNEILTHSKQVDCQFNSSWNGLEKQSSAEPNIILNFPSDTSFKQPLLFVQAAYVCHLSNLKRRR